MVGGALFPQSSNGVASIGELLLTPHMGYVTDCNIAIMYTDAIEDIEAFLDGKPVHELG